MSYGRFNEEERPIVIEEILLRITQSLEISFGYFLRDYSKDKTTYAEALVGYLHFNLFNGFSKRGYQASLGTVIADEHQGHGIGSQLLVHGLDEMRKLGYKRIWLTTHESNVIAQKLYRKCGFENEGFFHKDRIIDGKAVDVVSMAKLFG
jgi:putative acetyltransferase